jgi:hypothetical protein
MCTHAKSFADCLQMCRGEKMCARLLCAQVQPREAAGLRVDTAHKLRPAGGERWQAGGALISLCELAW